MDESSTVPSAISEQQQNYFGRYLPLADFSGDIETLCSLRPSEGRLPEKASSAAASTTPAMVTSVRTLLARRLLMVKVVMAFIGGSYQFYNLVPVLNVVENMTLPVATNSPSCTLKDTSSKARVAASPSP